VLVFKVWDLGYRIWDFRVPGLGSRVQGIRVLGC
jgi:hypothetical protein